MNMMKDSTRKGIRTVLQVLYTLLTTGGLVGLSKLLGIDVSQDAWTAIGTALLPIVVTINNALEDAGKIPAVLKYPGVEPAQDGGHPATDAEPTQEPAEEAVEADVVAEVGEPAVAPDGGAEGTDAPV